MADESVQSEFFPNIYSLADPENAFQVQLSEK